MKSLSLALALCLMFCVTDTLEAQVVEELVCIYDADTGTVEATWINSEVVDIVEVFEGGVLIQELFGNVQSTSIVPLPGATTVEYCFQAGQSGIDTCCTVTLPPPPVVDLTCPSVFSDDPASPVELDVSWTNGVDDYSDIDVFLCGELHATLEGTATALRVPVEPGTTALVEVRGRRNSIAALGARCSRLVPDVPPAPLNLDCVAFPGGTAAVTWVNGAPYDEICILVNNENVSTLSGDATSFTTSGLEDGPVTICVQGKLDDLVLESCCEVEVEPTPCPQATIDSVTPNNGGADILWTLPQGEFDFVDVYRDGEIVLQRAEVTVDSFFDIWPEVSLRNTITYHVAAQCSDGGTSFSEPVSVILPEGTLDRFVRGDCNNDGFQDIGDLIKLLVHLFLSDSTSQPLPCPDACDFNNDGLLELPDVLDQIAFYFRGGPEPDGPYPTCGTDTGESLGCPDYDQCRIVSWDPTGWSINPELDLADGGERPTTMDTRGSMMVIDPSLGPGNLMRRDCAAGTSGIVTATGELVFRPEFGVGVLPGLLPINYLDMTYSSKIDFQSCVGNGWNLWPLTDRIVVLDDGTVRRFDSQLARFDDYDPVTGTAPEQCDSLDDDCTGNPDDPEQVCFRSPNGMITSYDASTGLLRSMQDRHGNLVVSNIGSSGKDGVSVDDPVITSLTDAHGRTISYDYDEFGRLSSITDFADRVTTFEYDNSNHLVAVTLPAITGTPNDDDGIASNGTAGNDFPNGKTMRFRYDSTNPDPLLRDNLLGVTYPNEAASGGPERYQFQYGDIFGDPDFDRCHSVQSGSLNPRSLFIGEPPEPVAFCFEKITWTYAADNTRSARVTDGNGNVCEYQYDAQLRCVRIDELTERRVNPADPDVFTTLQEFDDESRLVSMTNALGAVVEYTYDTTNPNRRSQFNCLEVRLIPDLARGADQSELVTSYTYDPIYNQLRTVTTPRGNDESYSPPILDPQSMDLVDFNLDGDTDDENETVRRSRYTTVYIYDYQEGTAQEISDLAESQGVVGDLDGDGILDVAVGLSLDGDENGDGTTSQQAGSRIKVRFPWVRTDSDGTSVVEDIVSTHTYNEFGQCTSTADPEGNLTSCYYYPLLTPNEPGQSLSNFGGGFLRMVVADDDPGSASDPSSDDDRPIAQAIDNSGTDRRTRPAEFVVVKTFYEYDAVGNTTAVTDGRGVTTTFDINAHNQTMRMNKAELIDAIASNADLSAKGYVTEYCYDYNGNTVCVRTEDRGDTSQCGGNNGDIPFVDTDLRYDALDRLISVEREVFRQEFGPVQSTRSVYRYDANSNVVLEIAPEGNATTYVYDCRDLTFTRNVGALGLPPLVQLSPEDPTRFPARGGVPARHRWTYDAVGQVVETSDADDSDGSSANNSSVGGGDRTRYLYDGFSRLVSVVDSAGNQTVCQFDPDGNPVSQSVFGSTGGFTPSSNGPPTLDQPVSSSGVIQVGNLVSPDLLSRSESLYEERSNRIQGDAVLFHNSTPVTRELDLADGGDDVGKSNPIDGDDDAIPGVDGIEVLGRVNSQVEFDRNGCIVSTTSDTGDVTTCEYDGLNRLVVLTDSVGTIKECSYDSNSNLVETSTTHTSSDGSAPDRVFLYTYVYDSLNRCVRDVDNVGQTTYYRYDSRDNLVCVADPEGPDGDDVTRVFEGDSQTVNQTNDPGNVTLYYYDGLSRRVRSEQILTASGAGDGTLGCDEHGVKDSTTGPVPDTSQGAGDGIIRSGNVYDGNSNVVATLDDQGNVSIALYDNLDRCIAEASGLSVNSILTTDRALGGRQVPAPTAKTMHTPLFFPVALLNAQMAALEEQLAELDVLFPQLADRVDASTSQIYGIDTDGDLRLHLDENGSEWHNYYDALHQVLARRCFRSGQNDDHSSFSLFDTPPVPIWGDGGGSGGSVWLTVGTNAQDFEYDGHGRVTFSGDYLDTDSDNDGLLDGTECSFSYDSLGNCVEESRTLSNGDTTICSSGYRGGSLRSSLTYPNGRVLEYDYDGLDRLTAIIDTVAGASVDLATFDYMGPSLLMRRTHGNLVVSNIGSSGKDGVSYDGGGRVTQLEHLDTLSRSMMGFTYDHDRRGLRVSQEKSHDSGNNENWSFDSMGRITGFERPNTGAQTPLHSSFELDGVGNWASVDSETREHTNFNELVNQIDADGNETASTLNRNGQLVVSNIGSSGKDGVRNFEYDALDRLVRVSEDDAVGINTTIAVYVYDAHDRRAVSNIGSSGKDGVSFAWDGSDVIEERDLDDALLAQYCWGGSGPPVCYDSFNADGTQATYYCLSDVAGSCYGLTDAEGNLVEAYMYDAHGRQTIVTEETGGTVDFGDTTVYTAGGASGLGFPYLFQGMRYDEETNLYHDAGSYCSSSRGRYLTRDGGGSHEIAVDTRAKASANEGSAIGSLRTLVSSQAIARETDRSGGGGHGGRGGHDTAMSVLRKIGIAQPGGGTGSGMGSREFQPWNGTYKGKFSEHHGCPACPHFGGGGATRAIEERKKCFTSHFKCDLSDHITSISPITCRFPPVPASDGRNHQYSVDSFFDIAYRTFNVDSFFDIDYGDRSFIVDSFFDIHTEARAILDFQKPDKVVRASRFNVDSFFDIDYGDRSFNVDSFFDIDYGDRCFNVDSFFDIDYGDRSFNVDSFFDIYYGRANNHNTRRSNRQPSFGGGGSGASAKKGDKVSLIGFGSWSISNRAARKGRNPQTGKEIQIKAKKVAKFKAGKALSDTVK